MTRREERLAARLSRTLGGALPVATARRLLDNGLLDIRACERRIVRSLIGEFEQRGASRCGAMQAVAEELGCSYAKVRTLYYETFQKPRP